MAKRIRIALIAAAMTLLLAMGAAAAGMNVHAAKNPDQTDTEIPSVTKNVTVPDSVTFKNGDAVTLTVEQVSNTDNVLAPNQNGSAFSNLTNVNYTTTYNYEALNNKAKDATADANNNKTLTFTKAIFKNGNFATGEYTFKVTESYTAADGNGTWSSADTNKEYYVHVYKTDNSVSYSVTTANAENKQEKTDNFVFNNTYSVNNATATITKNVENDTYVAAHDYEFTVTFTKTPINFDAANLSVKVDNNEVTKTASSASSFTFKMAAGKTATISNLPVGAEMKVVETKDTDKNYTGATVTVDRTNKTQIKHEYTTENPDSTSAAIVQGDNTYKVLNKYNKTTVTGVITQIAPFIAMVAIAGGAVALYLVSRKRRDA